MSPGPSADERWFDELFTATYDDLLAFAARRVGIGSAHDVVAEMFLTAWRRRESFARAQARLWLFGTARLVAANSTRTATRSMRLAAKVASTEAEEPDFADALVGSIRVRAVIDALPAAEAEALRLVAWDGFDLAEAATIAGCSRATFRVRFFRARRRAAALLEAGDGASVVATRGLKA